jgi:hypothetical protein
MNSMKFRDQIPSNNVLYQCCQEDEGDEFDGEIPKWVTHIIFHNDSLVEIRFNFLHVLPKAAIPDGLRKWRTQSKTSKGR